MLEILLASTVLIPCAPSLSVALSVTGARVKLLQILRSVSLHVHIVAAAVYLSAVAVDETIGRVGRSGVVQPPWTLPVPQRRLPVSPMLPISISVVSTVTVRLMPRARVPTPVIVVLLVLSTSMAVRGALAMAAGRMLTIVSHIARLRPISKRVCLSFIISIIVNWLEGLQLIGWERLLLSKGRLMPAFLLPILSLHIQVSRSSMPAPRTNLHLDVLPLPERGEV